jgi:hypothetical protein
MTKIITDPIVVQGQVLSPSQIDQVRQLFEQHPDMLRTPASKLLCQMWDWLDELGRPKDMACRLLLRKLEQRGLVRLPAKASNGGGARKHFLHVALETSPINCPLSQLLPVRLENTRNSTKTNRLFCYLVQTYHYLGFSDIGRKMKYVAFDCQGRPLACLLFGGAAWKVQPRDHFIGWDRTAREANLQRIANNTRFLILPWVRVPHLASFLLARAIKQLRLDWTQHYGPLAVLETFVDRSRFKGTCYRAANWIYVGQTKGRSRYDRYSTLHVPLKDIYLYPLRKDFRTCLTQ